MNVVLSQTELWQLAHYQYSQGGLKPSTFERKFDSLTPPVGKIAKKLSEGVRFC